MVKTALAAAGLATLLATPAIAGPSSTGPFTGTVRQGQTKTHRYDNNPAGNPCPLVIVNYTVSLTYAPTSDTLTLTVGDTSVTGSGGSAVMSFEASYCTSFAVKVTGTSVADTATYTVTVSRGGGAVA